VVDARSGAEAPGRSVPIRSRGPEADGSACLNRVAASLKDGLIRPPILISKLQAMQLQNPLQQALQELERLAKTLHILEYVDDPAFRRRVLIGLNKGEHFTLWRATSPLGDKAAFTIEDMKRSSTEHQRSHW